MAGENETSIGTARAYLDIDATDWDTAIARAKNSAAGLGTAAEKAFDAATGAQKRAATQLLTYVTGLDRTADQQRVLTALMKGVPVDVAKAAAAAIETQRAATAAAAEEQRKLNEQIAQQAVIDKERASQGAANAQEHINSLLGVNSASSSAAASRRADAESAFVKLLDEEAQAWNLATVANEEYDRQVQISAQRQINLLLGVREAQSGTRRQDAEVAFTQLLDEEAAAWQEAIGINEEYNRQFTANAQQQINALLGVQSAAERARQAANNRALASQFEPSPNASADNAFIQSLQRQYDYAGKTHFEILRLQAAEKGLTESAGPLIDKLEQQALSMRSGTLSTKQYEFALRGLPAQFTDIFTSLAAGQSPLLVFLQQGGQIKDMFGGIGAAARVVGQQILKFITNPFTLAAGVIAGLVYGLYEGHEQFDRLDKIVKQTGGTLGTSAQQFDQAAVAAGRATGQWGKAREAIEALAKENFTGAGIGGLGVTIVDVAKVTGQSVDQIVADFKSLETKPAESVAKLNEQYNFLTAAQFAQIQSLEEVGRTRDAARIAEQAYSQAMHERAAEIDANAGWIVRSAHAVRDAWDEAWNSLKHAGAPDSLAEQAASLQAQIDAITHPHIDRQGNLMQGSSEAADKLRADLAEVRRKQVAEAFKAAQDQDDAMRNQQSIQAQQALAQYADPKTKLDNSIKVANENRLKALAGVVDPARRAQIIAEANEQIKQAQEAYKSTLKKRTGSPSDDVAQIKADAAAQQAAIAAQTQFTQGQYQLRQITMEQYYAKLKELAQQSGDVEVKSLNKQIEAEKAHGASLQKIQQLQNEIVTSKQKTATQEAELDTQEALAIQARTDAIAAYKQGLDAQTLGLQRSLDLMVARVGMGQREFEVSQQINQVLNAQDDALAEIDREYAKSHDKVKRDEERNAVLEQTAERVEAIKNAYHDLDAAQANGMNGVKSAIDNFLDNQRDVAAESEQFTTSVINGFGDAFTSIVSGTESAKKAFGDMLDDMYKKALAFVANKAIQALLDSFGAGSTQTEGTTAGGWGSIVSNFISYFSKNAKGGVYDSPSLSAYSNQIVNGPTTFAFAHGMGLMGEAGPEAIMPLKRTADGRLGVSVSSSNTSTDRSVKLTQNIIVQGTVNRRTSSQIAQDSQRRLQIAQARNG